MNNPQDQIYIKRITRKERIREAITVFITLSAILLFIYLTLTYIEKVHAGEREESMVSHKFYILIMANEGKIKIRGTKSPWFIYSIDAQYHYRHKIEHVAENKYIMVYMNSQEPDTYTVQPFRVDGETITYYTPIKYTTSQYINLTKQDAQRILDATKTN